MDNWVEPSRLDRCENERLSPEWVEQQWADPQSLLLGVNAEGELRHHDLRALASVPADAQYDPNRHFLLGTVGTVPWFVVEVDATESMASLRDLSLALDAEGLELATAALALVNWHRLAGFCGRCGGPTTVQAGGFVRHCPRCDRPRFPRTDAAVIVAVLDHDDRLLLGHHVGWPAGRMSLLAGFLSVGESLEQAVRREIAEESGVQLGAVRYVASQPWPFPRSLMLGFVARAADPRITVDETEIEYARWFGREDLEAQVLSGHVTLPGAVSIAHTLVSRWRDGSLPAPEGA